MASVGGNYSQRSSTFPAIFVDWYAVSDRAACPNASYLSLYTYTCTCTSAPMCLCGSMRVCRWAGRWGWRIVGVKATTGADLNPRLGRWKGSNKSCARDEDESENTENRPLCRATLWNYFAECRFLSPTWRPSGESVTSIRTAAAQLTAFLWICSRWCPLRSQGKGLGVLNISSTIFVHFSALQGTFLEVENIVLEVDPVFGVSGLWSLFKMKHDEMIISDWNFSRVKLRFFSACIIPMKLQNSIDTLWAQTDIKWTGIRVKIVTIIPLK